jgi:uncharacterized membrane protein YfcA
VLTVRSLWMVLAGFGGGLAGSIFGLASLVSYPALLAVGLSPVAANVSNTVALVASGIGSVSGSLPELRGQRARARRLCALGVAGGVAGAVLLLTTPASTFERAVPVLIGLAALSIVTPLPPRRRSQADVHTPGWALSAAVFGIAIYGGYFGAGAGVLMLALLLAATAEPLARDNAMKNLVLGLGNAVAAVAFIAFGPVRWSVAIPLAAGFFVGGRIGPAIVRRAPPEPLRLLIACAGLGLAVHLGLDAYR